ncbi:hypothetical protein TWF173_008940 [Orbilia oligospora]|nr:hypothetical protein TWF173_008940 [Orbilia oligospora]
MGSFSLLRPASYRCFIILAAIVLIGPTSLLLLRLQNRAYVFQLKRNGTISDSPITPRPSTAPPVVYVSPGNPFDINFDETLYRNRGTSQVKIEADYELENTLSSASSLPSEGKRLHKRVLIPVSWLQMRTLINHPGHGPGRDLLLPGVTAALSFLSESEEYEENFDSIKKISEDLDAWLSREAATSRNSPRNSETGGFLYALRSYKDAVKGYPDFMSYMEELVPSLGNLGAFGSFISPDIMTKLVFMLNEEGDEELDDEWLRFLVNFFKESAEGLREWVDEVQFAKDTFVGTIKERQSQIVSDGDFAKLQADVDTILEWSSALAETGEKASKFLGEFREVIREVEYETPGTLPYTPRIGRTRWLQSPTDSEDSGNVFNRLDNEPLTPPPQIQGDEYIEYLRRPPWASNQNPGPMREEQVPGSDEQIPGSEELEARESNMQ